MYALEEIVARNRRLVQLDADLAQAVGGVGITLNHYNVTLQTEVYDEFTRITATYEAVSPEQAEAKARAVYPDATNVEVTPCVPPFDYGAVPAPSSPTVRVPQDNDRLFQVSFTHAGAYVQAPFQTDTIRETSSLAAEARVRSLHPGCRIITVREIPIQP